MRKHKLIAINCLLIIIISQCTKAEENFEDADQSNDFLSTSSSTNPNYDLRQTIPGEPGVDYPIHFSVPKTSFKCTGRHEGYYADIETRCQAFRICAHTARSAQGFGFLCPNGTLFSQKNFVCDWYRNVNCDESERYYSKNDVNRVGSNHDMMETVRQMMEYPMKTISKALQQNSDTTRSSSRNSSSSFRNKLGESSERKILAKLPANTRKSAVTRAQIESAYKYGSDDNGKKTIITESKTLTESNLSNGDVRGNTNQVSKIKSSNEYVQASTGAASDDVYVNSLGELSSDPGANFDESNSRIIAKAPSRSYQYGQKLNFAAKVNEALKGMVELPANDVIAPDYVKKLRNTEEGTLADLASNVNGLLDEVQNDLDPSMSGYQIPVPNRKHSFKFLSRGFAAQGDRGTYTYNKPKQTPSTIRFSPNQIPIESYKTSSHDTDKLAPVVTNTFEIADDAMEFSFKNTMPKPTETAIDKVEPPLFEIEAPAVDSNPSETPTEAPKLPSYAIEAPAVESVTTLDTTNDNIEFTIMTSTPKPNEVPIELTPEIEMPTVNTFENANEAIEFAIMTSTPKAEMPDESYLTAPTLSPFDDVPYLLPPRFDTTDDKDNDANTETFLRISVPDETEVVNNEDSFAFSQNNLNTKTIDAPSTTSEVILDSNDTSPKSLQQIQTAIDSITDELTAEIDNEDLEVNQAKLSVNQHAENLLLSGVKLSLHDEPIPNKQWPSDNELPTSTLQDTSMLPQIVAAPQALEDATILENFSNSERTTTPMSTSTETVTEISSTQQRIRNYRRFATLQRASVKPLIYTKRSHVRTIPKTLGNTTSTTKAPTSTSTTLSYLKRVAASRLRLSRLGSTGRNGAAASSSILNDIGDDANDAQQPEKKVSIRNLDRETGTLIQQNTAEESRSSDGSQKNNPSAATWESVRTNLQRYVSRKRSNVNSGYSYTTAAPVITRTTRAGSQFSSTTVSQQRTAQRSRNRYSNFKTPQNVRGVSMRTTFTTVSPITTTTTASTYTPASSSSYSYTQLHSSLPPLLSTVQPQTSWSSITSSNLPSSSSSSATSWSSSTSTSSSSSSSSSPSLSSSSTSSSSSSSIPSNFLSFDKLTRAIVDDSILQNFRSSQASAKPASFSSSSSQKSVFGGSLLQSTASPSVSSVSSFGFGRPIPQVPSQLTPPIRPQHLPIISQQQTTSTFSAPNPIQQTPRIVIARAEGQRIEPNSVHSIISSLAAQQLPKSSTQAKPYVPLDDFLTHKFGSSTSSINNSYRQQTIPTTATTFTTQQRQYTQQEQQPRQQQQQQQQQYQYKSITSQQQQQQPAVIQQQRNFYQQPAAPVIPTITTAKQQYPTINLAYIPQQQQHQQPQQQQLFPGQNLNNPQLHQQLNYPQQQSLLPLQPLNTQGIFATYKQHQKQLPQFPPLLNDNQLQQPLQQQQQLQYYGNFGAQRQQIDGNNYNQRLDSLNVKLPALPNGLIPAPTTQFAQKRSDFNVEMLQLSTDPPARSYEKFASLSSYDVPLSSIGRLPNDRTHLLRRLQRH